MQYNTKVLEIKFQLETNNIKQAGGGGGGGGGGLCCNLKPNRFLYFVTDCRPRKYNHHLRFILPYFLSYDVITEITSYQATYQMNVNSRLWECVCVGGGGGGWRLHSSWLAVFDQCDI
jgi:hypothetical protein